MRHACGTLDRLQGLAGYSGRHPAVAVSRRHRPHGGFRLRGGVDDDGFRALLSLLASGRVWVKLCAYRNPFKAPSIEAGRPSTARCWKRIRRSSCGAAIGRILASSRRPTPRSCSQFKEWTGTARGHRSCTTIRPGSTIALLGERNGSVRGRTKAGRRISAMPLGQLRRLAAPPEVVETEVDVTEHAGDGHVADRHRGCAQALPLPSRVAQATPSS